MKTKYNGKKKWNEKIKLWMMASQKSFFIDSMKQVQLSTRNSSCNMKFTDLDIQMHAESNFNKYKWQTQLHACI